MKKLPLVILALAIASLLSKCASVHIAHNWEAKALLRTLSKVPLPEGARVIEENSEVGGFISGTGDAIDVIAYRVFASDLSEAEVNQVFANGSHTDLSEGPDFGVFKLDRPEAPNPLPPEWFLRRMISPRKRSTYVVYEANRIDDGVWDWRGW